jgi:hypothetical protein
MAVQLIRNGGFESGALLPGWRQTPGSAALDGGVTDAVRASGSYSLELRSMDFVEQMFTTVRAYATGPLTFRVKTASALTAGPFFVRIEYTDGSANVPFLGSVPTRWTAKSFSVDGAKRLKRIQFGTGETGSVYVDDVSLVGSRTLLVGLPRRSSASKK